MAFGDQEAAGLLLLVAFIALAGAIAYFAARAVRLSRQAASKRAALDDLQERARVGAMRHRDFDAWFEADRKRRQRVGLPPLDKEEARSRRFDPTFELDVPAPRTADLRRTRQAVRSSVEHGEEPPASEELA